MAPVMRAAVDRDNDDELPFCLITHIDGGGDPYCGDAEVIVQLDFLDRGATTAQAKANAKAAADLGHRRMLQLARFLDHVTLSDGSVANPDWVEVLLDPTPMPYAHDLIARRVARYKLGLSYLTIA
jgi:hypothetical protein